MPLVNGVRHATAHWAGIVAVEEAMVELSHGISPGYFVLRIQPQPDSLIPTTGDLVIEDGVGVIKIPDCKVQRWRRCQQKGFVDELYIIDRRWRWLTLNRLAGCFNQLDPHAKLIPWTIRSPRELAKFIFLAMGEEQFEIDLPDGLNRAIGLQWAGLFPPFVGVQPTFGTNPPVDWPDGTIPPAVALSRLAAQYGRRVIYRWRTDSVVIAKPGAGDPLPSVNVSVARVSPSFKDAGRPPGVEVVGSQTRYQMRLRLKAVGRDFDGQYRPIDELSYAPKVAALPQIETLTFTPASDLSSDTYRLYLSAGPNQLANLGVQFTYTSTPGDTGSDIATAVQALIAASVDRNVAGKITVTRDDDTLTLTGPAKGIGFAFWAEMRTHNGGRMTGSMIQAPRQEARTWQHTIPGQFADVVATDRLSYYDAVDLAQSTVFLDYQLDDIDASGAGKINVPQYGFIERRQQLVLNPTKCAQIVPFPQDVQVRDGAGRPLTVNLYNGYSRDQPAVVYGRATLIGTRKAFYFVDANNPTYNTNTPPDRQLHIPFSIDPVEQLVRFDRYIYVQDEAGRVFPSPVTLETAVNVRDKDSNALDCYSKRKWFPGQSGDQDLLSRKFPDVQMNIIGNYSIVGFQQSNSGGQPGAQLRGENRHQLLSAERLENDPVIRARYYLDGMMAEFEDVKALTVEFNGLVDVDLDGATSQISWQINGGGCSTTVSQNTEHSIVYPPYPQRVRREFLDPVPQDPSLRGPLAGRGLMEPGRRS